MWVLVALITVAGATSPKRPKCPVYSPPYKTDCGPNAYWESCPPQCPPHQNCSILTSRFACIPDENYCCIPACRCKDGYYRDDNFKCISVHQCYPQSNEPTTIAPCSEEPACKANEIYVKCKVECPNNYCPVNDNRGILICDPPRPCPPGCICNFGYRRKSRKEPTCILAEDCPPVKCTRPNEVWSSCPSTCLAESCRDVNNQPTTCNDLVHNCEPRCICAKGFFRNDNEECVCADDCPGQDEPTTVTPCPEVSPKPTPKPSKKCKGPNEKLVKCKTICPPQSCDISYTTYTCPRKQKCIRGCDCIKGYLRLKNGTCVKNDDCPPPFAEPPTEEPECGYNEVRVSCPQTCPPQSCEALYLAYLCAAKDDSVPCEPGCNCKENHLRNASKICVPVEECPLAPWIVPITPLPPTSEPTTIPPCHEEPVCIANETYVRCKVECPNNYCPVNDNRGILICDPPWPCPPGCTCKLGYRRKSTEEKSCILAEECPPVECTRPNEVWSPCPSGCRAEYCTEIKDQPSACNELVKNCQPKCICAEGYYRNENDNCVPASDCGQANCGVNKTIVFCTFKCPHQFCPENDSLDKYACKPPRDCPPGCGCKEGYRFKSFDDDTCVLAQDCPPVTCTRPNEEWNCCPLTSDACEDRNKTQSECCETTGNCDPRCVCKKGFHRNADKTCVPACECD